MSESTTTLLAYQRKSWFFWGTIGTLQNLSSIKIIENVSKNLMQKVFRYLLRKDDFESIDGTEPYFHLCLGRLRRLKTSSTHFIFSSGRLRRPQNFLQGACGASNFPQGPPPAANFFPQFPSKFFLNPTRPPDQEKKTIAVVTGVKPYTKCYVKPIFFW